MAATHDVILSSIRYMQLSIQPTAGLTFLKEDVLRASAAGQDLLPHSLVMSDEVLFNFVLPSFETVFVGRDIHR